MIKHNTDTFAKKLLRIYDRKLLSGEITFSESGIKKDDFTRLCVDKDFVIPRDRLEIICDKMNLNKEERAELISFTE